MAAIGFVLFVVSFSILAVWGFWRAIWHFAFFLVDDVEKQNARYEKRKVSSRQSHDE